MNLRRIAATTATVTAIVTINMLSLGSLAIAANPQPIIEAPLPKSEVLQRVISKGVLVVGVKTDYRPFGQLDANGVPEGLEHDLAADVARRLGVKLEKVSVTGANRLQRLEEGVIDMVIATTGDTADRRRIATMIEPNYYSSGATLLVARDQKISKWSDMRGKSVCAIQGSYQNRPMAQQYLLEISL
jgi:polar amino acid transport system substrate-binding protein